MLNLSSRLGNYPSKLKIAKIMPIFKSDNETDANNCRPISLFSTFNRIFEKVGFPKGHSTQHAILDIVNDITSTMVFPRGPFLAHYFSCYAILDIVNDIQANMNQRLLSCGVLKNF